MTNKPKNLLCLDKEDLIFGNDFLIAPMIYNIANLFIKAQRIYFEYYLDNIDEICLLASEKNSQDPVLLKKIEVLKENGELKQGETARQESLRQYINEAGSEGILILTTKARAREFNKILKSQAPEIKATYYFCLPDKVASREIEPGWNLLKEYLKDKKPNLVLSALGWEKVIYGARLKDFYGASFFDWGYLAPRIKAKNIFLTRIKNLIKRSLNLK